jgi:hypothetical protein
MLEYRGRVCLRLGRLHQDIKQCLGQALPLDTDFVPWVYVQATATLAILN